MGTKMLKSFLALTLLTLYISLGNTSASLDPEQVRNGRSFEIDYETDSFSMDGKPFRYVAGSLHYFRVPHQYWQDRLRKLRAAGLNAVDTYVEWSTHQPEPADNYYWEGDADLEHFIQLAAAEDLYVILRPGPYICAERDFGGQPWWLLSEYYDENPKTQLRPRTKDERYLREIRKWLDVLLSKISPYLYGNGGPIIMVQVENEYGSLRSRDEVYTYELSQIFRRHIQDKAVLFTTDWYDAIDFGKIQQVYATVDFGHSDDIQAAWAAQRKVEPSGPLVNSEYYTGWLTHWGEKNHANVASAKVTSTLEKILADNASVSLYMFAGGTNFGFSNGANKDVYGITYDAQITSYDYDAPLTEAGDPTEKYLAIRETIGKFLPLPDLPIPQNATKGDYGRIQLHPLSALLEESSLRFPPTDSEQLQTFEELGQRSGLILYITLLEKDMNATLWAGELRDRALVYIDDVYVGLLDRHNKTHELKLEGEDGSLLQIIVENQGRVNYGDLTVEYKGLNSPVTWGQDILKDWMNIGIPLEIGPMEDEPIIDLDKYISKGKLINGPIVYSATFNLSTGQADVINDTFLDMSGWDKGVVWLNGHNLGRYWPTVGPQITLYVPGVYLKHENNRLDILELQTAPEDLSVTFITEHKLNKNGAVRIKSFIPAFSILTVFFLIIHQC